MSQLMEACIVIGSSALRRKGFTLIELVVVLLVISLLAGLAAPVISNAVTRAKEAALKESLQVTRRAIDEYMADHGYYPDDLEILVEKKYIRSLPWDPILKSDQDWDLIDSTLPEVDGIENIESSSEKEALDGSYYSDW